MNVENLTPDEEIIHRLGGQIKLLQKKLDIATSALQYYAEGTLGSSVAEQALKDMDLVGTSMSLAKEEV